MRSTFTIVGMQHRKSEAFVADLKDGESIILRREGTNKYDENAVQVHARGQFVGYIKKAENAELAKVMDMAGVDVPATFVAGAWPCLQITK